MWPDRLADRRWARPILVETRYETLARNDHRCFDADGGCNAIEGAGKDIQKGGEKVEDAAKNTKDKM